MAGGGKKQNLWLISIAVIRDTVWPETLRSGDHWEVSESENEALELVPEYRLTDGVIRGVTRADWNAHWKWLSLCLLLSMVDKVFLCVIKVGPQSVCTFLLQLFLKDAAKILTFCSKWIICRIKKRLWRTMWLKERSQACELRTISSTSFQVLRFLEECSFLQRSRACTCESKAGLSMWRMVILALMREMNADLK